MRRWWILWGACWAALVLVALHAESRFDVWACFGLGCVLGACCPALRR